MTAEFDLADFASVDDYVLISISPSVSNQSFDLRTDGEWDVGPEHSLCLTQRLGTEGGEFLFTGGKYVLQPTSSTGIETSVMGTHQNYVGNFATKSGVRLPFLFGYDHSVGVDGRLQATLHSNQTFSWEIADQGDLECLRDADEFPRGEFTRTSVSTYARDVGVDITVGPMSRTLFWAAVASDDCHVAAVEASDGALWTAEHSELGTPNASHAEFILPPGDYSFEVPILRGTAAYARAIILTVPEWAAEGFRQPPAAQSSVANAPCAGAGANDDRTLPRMLEETAAI
jgi:hypothetical protein